MVQLLCHFNADWFCLSGTGIVNGNRQQLKTVPSMTLSVEQ